jgi:hypothetical protein
VGSAYRDSKEVNIRVSVVDKVDDSNCRFAGPLRLVSKYPTTTMVDSRIALLGIYEIRNFKIESEVWFEVLWITSII